LHGRRPALGKYTLGFAGRIPSITVRIHGDRSAFYEEVKTHYSWVSWRETDEHYWFYDVRTYEEIRTEFTSINEWDSTFKSLTVTVDDSDFRDPSAGDDLKKKLEEMAFDVLKNNVLPSFFEDKWAPSDDEKKTGFT